MEKIIGFLKEKYRLTSLVLSGDYAEGDLRPGSTFEGVGLGPTSPYAHETGTVEGVKLDVLVYPRDIFYGEIALDDFEQLHEGLVVLDEDGMGSWLKRMIGNQIASIPLKPDEAVEDALHWCETMAESAAAHDAEGYFCRHWLLTDSVEVYSDVCGLPFLSPRKTMSKMAKNDPEAAAIHLAALSGMDDESLAAWVKLLRERFERRKKGE